MKTILILFESPFKNEKSYRYAFNTEDDIKVGDVISSPSYTSNMEVVAVLEEAFKYVNALTGELTMTINSTKCCDIKTLKLGEENTTIVYGKKVESHSENL